jgi:hypothetical protein
MEDYDEIVDFIGAGVVVGEIDGRCGEDERER